MVDRNVIASKLEHLADLLAFLRARCPVSEDDLVADRDTRDLVSCN